MSIRQPPPYRASRRGPAVSLALLANIVGLLLGVATVVGAVVLAWSIDTRLGVAAVLAVSAAVSLLLIRVTDEG